MRPARVLGVSLIALVAGCGEHATPPTVAESPFPPPIDEREAARPVPAGFPDFTELVRRQGPAVVNISAARGGAKRRMPEFLHRFMPDPSAGRASPNLQGIGSGFLISTDGYILTNGHVVDGAARVSVRLAGTHADHAARVVGIDRRTDVALLKIDASRLPAVVIGDATAVKVGEWVAAIGSPFGFASTITAGIVSATGREIEESMVPFIQTDVAVNPGNSGGPLLNLGGEVIGINSMIYSQTGGYMGVSFAIPIDVAMQVGEQLRTTGKVVRGRIGVRVGPVTEDLARSVGLAEARGALVTTVERRSPAALAGVRPGDVILRFGSAAVARPGDLVRSVTAARPGTPATVALWRNEAESQVSVTVAVSRD